MTSYVVDSSVILERIIRSSPYKAKVERLFNEARNGGVTLFITLPTLSEVLYAASRIYELAGVEQPNEEAGTLVEWVKTRCRVAAPGENTAMRAGELKKVLKLALVDCYVIAAAEELGCKALFLKREREMLEREELLKRLPIEFLAERDI